MTKKQRAERAINRLRKQKQARASGSLERMVRLDCDTGKIPEVPQDDYMPVWNYKPVRESASDSMAMGHWVWRKVFVGYVGAITGVMLGPEWADILEVTPEPNDEPSEAADSRRPNLK